MNIPQHELPFITALIDTILSKGLFISVHNSETFTILVSRDKDKILNSLNTADMDTIYLAQPRKELGGFHLIYNNGSEDDPSIVIADYFSNALCDTIYNEAKEAIQ